jgi:hypothetical protein
MSPLFRPGTGIFRAKIAKIKNSKTITNTRYY